MAFVLKAAAASIPASRAASAAGSASSASFAAAVPRRRAAATGRISFRGAAVPVVAVRAAAVAEDKRSISGAFAELREQGKASPWTTPSLISSQPHAGFVSYSTGWGWLGHGLILLSVTFIIGVDFLLHSFQMAMSRLI
jgi:hypothetical protein